MRRIEHDGAAELRRFEDFERSFEFVALFAHAGWIISVGERRPPPDLIAFYGSLGIRMSLGLCAKESSLGIYPRSGLLTATRVSGWDVGLLLHGRSAGADRAIECRKSSWRKTIPICGA